MEGMSAPERPDADLLRAAFELAPIGVLIARPDGHISWPNQAFCDMVGRPRDELVGTFAARYSHREDRLGEQVQFQQLLAGDIDEYQVRKRWLHADGGVVHTLQTVHRVAHGDDVRVVAHVVDITEQVRREQEAHTHERMRTVGRLAASIAHDFNNLLTAIQANASMLSEVIADGDGRDMVDDVMVAAETGARLTDRLLGFSRGGVARSERLDLAALVQDRHPAFRAIAPGSKVEVDTDDAAWVFGDFQQLEQVLLNLVANASVAQKVTIRVRQRWSEVHLEVVDDGPGMSDAVRERAFEPYFTTRPDTGGTGLGLTTVYAVVTGHSGTVAIDSELGRGTTVAIRLPAVEPPTDGKVELEDNPNLDPRGRTLVMVLDDDGPVRRAVARALRASGCEVLEADGVGTARARIARHAKRLSLVIADVVLRDGNGVDFVAEIRRHRPDLPVLYMSGYEPAELQAYTNEPLEPMLTKPFSPQDVLAAVAPLLT